MLTVSPDSGYSASMASRSAESFRLIATTMRAARLISGPGLSQGFSMSYLSGYPGIRRAQPEDSGCSPGLGTFVPRRSRRPGVFPFGFVFSRHPEVGYPANGAGGPATSGLRRPMRQYWPRMRSGGNPKNQPPAYERQWLSVLAGSIARFTHRRMDVGFGKKRSDRANVREASTPPATR